MTVFRIPQKIVESYVLPAQSECSLRFIDHCVYAILFCRYYVLMVIHVLEALVAIKLSRLLIYML